MNDHERSQGDPFDGYDPFDAELGARLRAFGGKTTPDASTTLSGMRPALKRARVRRRIALGATSAALALGVGGAAVAVTGNGGLFGKSRVTIAPAADPATSTSAGQQTPSVNGSRPGSGPGSQTSSGSGPGTATSQQASRATTGVPQAATGSTATSATATITTTQSSITTGNTSGSTSSSSASTSTVAPTSTTAPRGPQTQTFSGAGGSVTITWNTTAITARNYQASGGYTVTVRYDLAARYEVRFDNGPNRTDIKLIVKNGALQPQVIES